MRVSSHRFCRTRRPTFFGNLCRPFPAIRHPAQGRCLTSMPRSGIKGIETVAWGTHLCLFYKSIAELRQLLTAYFHAGLTDGECCIWITGPSLNGEEALESLQRSMPAIADYFKTGQLEIVPHTQWYETDGVFRSEAVLRAWFDKLQRSSRHGFTGLRVA